jgi:formylglycine-generating enzyme required for sulfatase activity
MKSFILHPSSFILHPLAFLLLAATAAHAAPPAISNIRASQRPGTKLVDILYDAVDPDSATITVQLELSADSGRTFDLPVRSVSGHIGANVPVGANRQITWNAGNDWNGNFSPACRARIWAYDGSVPVPPAGMAYIPPGTFTFGYLSPANAGGITTLTKGYFMDRFEVSGALYNQVNAWAIANGYTLGGCVSSGDKPVHSVTWVAATRFCNARSQMEGLTPCYYSDTTHTSIVKTADVNLTNAMVKWSANGYRLPTEAEWERAARGGLDKKLYPWGDTITGNQANYVNSGDPFDNALSPVGYYNGFQSPAGVNMANGYGLYDMAGNASEWCWDGMAGIPVGQIDPTGPDGATSRVMKSGNWGESSLILQCGWRTNGSRFYSEGFRCVRGL